MSENKYKFEKLTPTDNVDLAVYEEAMNFVFENKDIRNVAISGAYSSGKSSILASYKKRHSNLCFLHISLAHFQSLDEKDERDKGISIRGKNSKSANTSDSFGQNSTNQF